MDRDHFSNFSFPNLRRLHMKFEQNWLRVFRGEVVWKCLQTDTLKDGRTHAQTDDRQKVITIAHPEHSSGELKTLPQHKSTLQKCPRFRPLAPSPGLNSGSILIELHKTLLCTHAPNMNAFCCVTVEIWTFKKNIYRSVTCMYTYTYLHAFEQK